MYLKNKIVFGLCVAAATVSFLHPFSGKTVCAEPVDWDNGADDLLGISDTTPKTGQKNRYEYAGKEAIWTVPATGYYDLYCCGAQGGSGGYDGNEDSFINEGEKGRVCGARAFLEKGTELEIRVGQMPGNSSCSYGEGATNGKKYENIYGNYIGDFATYWKRITYWESRTFGEAHRYRGYPDGEFGEEKQTICDRDGNHSGGAVGGGGGGSSCIYYDGTMILSAQGGKGGSSYYRCSDGKDTAEGGNGGGSTQIAENAGIIWKTEEMNEVKADYNEGHGYVLIEVVNIGPVFTLEASNEEWTREDVSVRAAIESEGQGLPEMCFSWERDETGNDIWTDASSYTISENGTYVCKIRDLEGNISEVSIEIGNIDKFPPKGEIVADITDWTKEAVLLRVNCDDAEDVNTGKSGLADMPYFWKDGAEEEPEKEGEGWTDIDCHTVSQNGRYSCKVRDKAGNITEISYMVENIDITPPRISYERKGKWYVGETGIFVTGEDIQPDGGEGCGIAQDAYSFDGIHFSAEREMQIKEEGIYHVWVKDKLGNIGELQMELLYDKKTKNEDAEKDEKIREEIVFTENIVPEVVLLETAVPEAVMTTVENQSQTMSSNQESEEENEVLDVIDVFPLLDEKEMQADSEIQQEEPEIPESGLKKILEKYEPRKMFQIKQIILYSVWMVVVLCGLLWMLFSLIFEHVIVYRKDERGKYSRIGRCIIYRKKEYFQINLIHFMKKGDERDYMIGFSKAFVWRYKKEKVLIRTWKGVELRRVAGKIEMTGNPI